MVFQIPSLLACQPSADKPASETVNPTSVFSADGIPHAQLPDNVVPQNYRVDMRMNPAAETMSGTVEIEVEIQEATQKIWLHGKNMTVSAATVSYELY